MNPHKFYQRFYRSKDEHVTYKRVEKYGGVDSDNEDEDEDYPTPRNHEGLRHGDIIYTTSDFRGDTTFVIKESNGEKYPIKSCIDWHQYVWIKTNLSKKIEDPIEFYKPYSNNFAIIDLHPQAHRNLILKIYPEINNYEEDIEKISYEKAFDKFVEDNPSGCLRYHIGEDLFELCEDMNENEN
jgi:hypothetical protein